MLTLKLLISVACQFSNMNIPTETKISCLENITNCAIIEDGKTNDSLIKKCVDKYGI